MTNDTHTPGPWNVYFDDEGVVIRAGGDVMGMTINGLQMEANARLIEAAPEILDMLKGWIERYEQGRCPDGALLGNTRQIIAKAEGAKQ